MLQTLYAYNMRMKDKNKETLGKTRNLQISPIQLKVNATQV